MTTAHLTLRTPTRPVPHFLWLRHALALRRVMSRSRTIPREGHLMLWARAQRSHYADGTLDPDRARFLEMIPGWTW